MDNRSERAMWLAILGATFYDAGRPVIGVVCGVVALAYAVTVYFSGGRGA